MADQFSSNDSYPLPFLGTREEKFALIVKVATRVHEKEERAQTWVMVCAFLAMLPVAILHPRNINVILSIWALIVLLGLIAWWAFCSYFRTSEMTNLCDAHLTKEEFQQLREDDPHAASVLRHCFDRYQKF
jgi:hypothetical protein